jgi:hypothetical protein
MGTVLLLAILVVVGLLSLGSGFFVDDAFGRAFKGETPRESDLQLFVRWVGYLALGIFVHVAHSFGWRTYLPLYGLLFSVVLIFAVLKRRRDAASAGPTSRNSLPRII